MQNGITDLILNFKPEYFALCTLRFALGKHYLSAFFLSFEFSSSSSVLIATLWISNSLMTCLILFRVFKIEFLQILRGNIL